MINFTGLWREVNQHSTDHLISSVPEACEPWSVRGISQEAVNALFQEHLDSLFD